MSHLLDTTMACYTYRDVTDLTQDEWSVLRESGYIVNGIEVANNYNLTKKSLPRTFDVCDSLKGIMDAMAQRNNMIPVEHRREYKIFGSNDDWNGNVKFEFVW